MIDVSDECASILNNRTFTMSARASVSLGGTVLLDDIPIITGTEEFDDNLRVPERIVINVPRIVDGVDLIPTATTDPLAPYGQRLHVKIGIGLGQSTEWLNRGEFLIQEVRLDGTEIQVTAVGLLALIEEARLVAPFKPTTTLTNTVRTLIEPALTVLVDAGPTALDRAVPAGLNEDEDRLGLLEQVLTAWPARAQMHPAGYLQVLLADDYGDDDGFVQLYNFTDPLSGNVQNLANIIEVGGAITREGLYNTAVARGQAADGQQIIGVAYDTTPGGPTSLRGNFNPLPVPIFYYSPLLTTAQQCQDAAASILTRKAAQAAQRLQMRCVPDPRFVGNDLIRYKSRRSSDLDLQTPVVIERLTLPYTSGSGPMTLVVREVT